MANVFPFNVEESAHLYTDDHITSIVMTPTGPTDGMRMSTSHPGFPVGSRKAKKQERLFWVYAPEWGLNVTFWSVADWIGGIPTSWQRRYESRMDQGSDEAETEFWATFEMENHARDVAEAERLSEIQKSLRLRREKQMIAGYASIGRVAESANLASMSPDVKRLIMSFVR